jgi:uncharacterized protein YciI
MKQLFAVTRTRGHAWDVSKPMNAQDQWTDHATFMNRVVADGFVVLGGPLGDLNDVFLLIIDAADASEINATLDRDPWTQSGMLEIKDIQPWTILLEANKEA